MSACDASTQSDDERQVPRAVTPREAAVRESGPSRARTARWAALALLALLALFLAGYLPRRAAREQLAARAETQAKASPGLVTIHPKRLERARVLKLSASLAAHEQTTLHARAQGYVRRLRVDLGDRVEAGAVLVEIDTPELDRELDQARASVAEREAALTLARAAHDFSRSSLARYTTLGARKLTSREELEQHQAEASVDAAKVQVAEAELRAERAKLRRLEQLKAFAEVRAPFSGTITARTVERGALVTPGAGMPLLELASLDPLRVTLDVPQSWAAGITPGLKASLTLPEYPGQSFEAVVARSAGRLDPKTRTLRVELEVPNAEAKLLSGMYGSVELSLEAAHDVYVLPATALLTGRDGSKVAVVHPDGAVRLAPVLVERDNGADVEIATGLDGSETLLANPGQRSFDEAPSPKS